MSVHNKTVIVTGATNGIGEVSALELARMNATVIIISRNEQKCQRTVTRIKHETGNPDVDYLVADLSLMSEIRRVAEEFKANHDQLHILLNNAGGVFNTRKETSEHNEMTLALNHLNYFLLTHLLLDTIKATAAESGEARIVNVASFAHNFVSGVNFDDIQKKRAYNGFRAYNESKLMNIMFTFTLARRLADTNITVNTLHPGLVNTGFGENLSGPLNNLINLITPMVAISPQKGAQTSIYLASSPAVKGITGTYFADKKPAKVHRAAHDQQAQERLWTLSEELTGLRNPVS